MKRLMSIFAIFCFSSSAFAVVMVEPLVGYEMGTTKATTTSLSDTSGKATGAMFGARVGFKSYTGGWIAADYAADTGAKFKFDSDKTTSYGYAHSTFGVTLGLDTMVGFRLYAGYNFMDQTKITISGTQYQYKGGNSYKVGAGWRFHILPMALNVEYTAGKPKTYQVGSLSESIDQAYSKYDMSGVNVTLSFPFDIL